eukprot:TRINITY_DN23090_c0_g1_i1.p1 TRINITY_DN23090_c0_g1~~TRINITY_DN23090_c0_g1_i1.p1  ORF type:complete len:739 (+),score=158.26 TRINITY_DN23090_c0_g1_i1:395-2611(+)
MGAGASKSSDNPEGMDNAGGLLYVSLKMEFSMTNTDLVPHVYGSGPLIGSWDPSKSLVMERESTSMWELSFVVPPNHETLDFKFLLKPKDSASPVIVEEGFNRLLIGGILHGDSGSALFKIPQINEIVDYRVYIKADRVSPFDLAASWRAYKENLQPSTVRGIPDVSIHDIPVSGSENNATHSLELDLEHYEVRSPSNADPVSQYAANKSEDPRSLHQGTANSTLFISERSTQTSDKPSNETCIEHSGYMKSTSELETRSMSQASSVQKYDNHRELLVDRGVGNSPKTMRSGDTSSLFGRELKLDTENENTMPEAAGAVAAAAVADRMLGPKEDRQLAIVLVGLPARGKTFTAAKLTRYLRWLGHDTKHFNVGKYRRLKHGLNQSADFFRADNQEGVDARNEVAALAMEDMLAWMQEGGQVGIFDATNSTRQRRNMIMKMAEGKCKIIFLETICNDQAIIDRNIRLKIQQSPDYANEPNFEVGLADFKIRLSNYEKVYEPVEEGSFIKMIDMVSGHGGQIQVNNISGYLPGRIVFFLVNTHLTPRPILLTRHGESRDNVRGRIGGDSVLSEAGEKYAKKLADFVNKRLKSERAASIWTSTLQRSILSARHIGGFPKIQWRALDEIYAGVCDGMTYEEIKKNMPEEYEARKSDKLRYRYPRGESYLDVIQRLEPVIIELERQRAPVVVIAHQAVLRALYAYFADRPLKEVPHIEVPLHTIIEIQMGVTGVQEKLYKLMD